MRLSSVYPLLVVGMLLESGRLDAAPSQFTRLEPLSPPKISASAPPFPGQYLPANLLDGKLATEYSSNGNGTNTFVEFDFGATVPIAAFRHIDRNDPATVAASELTFKNERGEVVSTLEIKHVNTRGGSTFTLLPGPVAARRVRWQITQLGAGYPTVGGAEVAFFKAASTEPSPSGLALSGRNQHLLQRQGERLMQPVQITLDYPYAQVVDGTFRLEGAEPRPVKLQPGTQTFEVAVPAVEAVRTLKAEVEIGGTIVSTRNLEVGPVKRYEIFLLPHSHVDIGYTALQAEVEQKQDQNIETGLRLAQATAGYPEGARFVWNVEVLWPVENYLRSATPEKRAAFIGAVKSGQIGLDAFYCNILTGLCRPEELIQLMDYATCLGGQCGVPVESAMISDVPGYTWSTVSAMAQAGVKYFSFAPNYYDRMGGTMKEWQNKPFWWKGPDGRSRVLCWCPSRGYALGHLIGDGDALAGFIPSYLVELETNSYPYEIACLRWNVHGDNGSPDERIANTVRDWNAKYVYPRLIISRTADAFRAFERRYGSVLPEYAGDYTPYWEDGAASSAFETALNRASAERLVQSEILWASRNPEPFPAAEFHEAWRNVLLYSEHTWGAHNSISEPDLPFVRDQWKIKQAFALDADKQSRHLFEKALANTRGADGRAGALEVFNTASWERTDLVTVPAPLSTTGDRVLDDRGRPVPSQRLSTGELAFLARDIPALGSRKFRIQPGKCPESAELRASGNELHSPEFQIRVDPVTGGIVSLFSRVLNRELVNPAAPTAINDYFYLPGSDVKKTQRNGPARVSVKEAGPLVASLLIRSEAPGCKSLVREVRLIAGLDRLELINTVDKLPVRMKEGLHFGYGFQVPNGTVRMDVGWAAVRPELDQIPASCKNWFSVQRWLDISNERFGVTWSPVDAPLVELGGLTANLIGSQTDPSIWIQHLPPTQTIYSWVMNNHWHTNYRADQEGPTVFRYAIRVHKGFAPDEAARFGTGCSQPLIVSTASSQPDSKALLKLSSDEVLVTALKPADDGKGWIVRLFGASGRARTVTMKWSNPAPKQIWLSDTSEKRGEKIGNRIEVPAWGIITLRAE
jgi:alpha-mannosidase